MHSGYPSHAPPLFKLKGSFYQPRFEEIAKNLKDVWMTDMPIIFIWYENLKFEYLDKSPVDMEKKVSR